MLPNEYLAAMIAKSSSDFSDVVCTCMLLSNQCPSTFGLVSQVLPVNFFAAAELPWTRCLAVNMRDQGLECCSELNYRLLWYIRWYHAPPRQHTALLLHMHMDFTLTIMKAATLYA